MLTTYEAVLHGNRIEWKNDAPHRLAQGRAVNVHITVLDELEVTPPDDQGQRMAAALEQLAQLPFVAGVDAATWEREQRIERSLPHRDE